MLFDYPTVVHRRRHAPAGYANYQSYKEWLRDEFAFRCVYCLVRERFHPPPGENHFGVDHVRNQVDHPDLACAYDNLVYACNTCNALKQNSTLIDPCATPFSEHLWIAPDGAAQAKSPEGRILIKALRINKQDRIDFRSRLFRLLRICVEHPRSETARLFRRLFDYPDSLPNLAALKPPANPKAEAVRDCCFERRRGGELEETY